MHNNDNTSPYKLLPRVLEMPVILKSLTVPPYPLALFSTTTPSLEYASYIQPLI